MHMTKYVTEIKSRHTKRLLFIKLDIDQHKEFATQYSKLKISK